MAARPKPTWIAVMDGAQARFFALRESEDGQVFEEAAAALSAGLQSFARDERSDKPGRAFASAGGGVRHALEPRHDYHKLEKRNFARAVAKALDQALAARNYGKLVLVAPPRSLGELRELLSDRVLKSLAREVPKNLTKLPPDALWAKLSAHLLRAAKPMSGTGRRAAVKLEEKSMPVSVVFRNMEASPSVQAKALQLAAKLGRKFGRIVSCRVIVEAQTQRQRRGKLFRVILNLKLPGREIAAKSGGEIHHAHADVGVALREAFAAATRQMQNYVGRRNSAAPQTRRSSSLRGKRLVEEG